jgi:cell division protein FtsB
MTRTVNSRWDAARASMVKQPLKKTASAFAQLSAKVEKLKKANKKLKKSSKKHKREYESDKSDSDSS